MKERITRVLFAGSAEFSMPTLRTLHKRGIVCAVLTSADKRAGRGKQLQQNCVAAFAHSVGLPLIQAESLRSDARAQVDHFKPQLMVCVAYGKIFGPRFLSLFPRGAVNVHPSLLPRFRGPAPVPATILAGDACTGLTLQTMSVAMDEGDILLQTKRFVRNTDTSESLLEILAQDGACEVQKFIDNVDEVYASAYAQDHENAVYCTKLSPAYGRISWIENAQTIERIVRAFSKPYWGARAYYQSTSKKNVQTLTLWNAHLVDDVTKTAPAGTVLGCDEKHGILIQTARGILGCTELQLPTRKRLFWKSFIQGEPHIIHTRLC